MDDIEKNRMDYVQRIEEQLQHLQRQLAEVKPLAEKWTPKVSGEISVAENQCRITLVFGGKRTTATFDGAHLATNTTEGLVDSIANTLAESLLVDRIKEVIRPEVERLAVNARTLPGAGKW
jgi:hypothetical protein